MFGYVTVEKGELKVNEFEKYNGYYCGICKSVGRRLGQIPRLALSYDSVFLALLMSGLNEEDERLEYQHCIVHHITKKPVIINQSAVDYAADMMVILAYHKFLDDWNDERSIDGFAGKTFFWQSYKKVKKIYPIVCEKVEAALSKLSLLEKEKSGNLDSVTDAFADVMEALFEGMDLEADSRRILTNLGRNLGKWIYLIDAVDDFDDDLTNEEYNPLINRFEKKDRDYIASVSEPILYHYMGEISNAYDLLPIKRNSGILENIIFMGLRKRTDSVLKKGTEKDEQSI